MAEKELDWREEMLESVGGFDPVKYKETHEEELKNNYIPEEMMPKICEYLLGCADGDIDLAERYIEYIYAYLIAFKYQQSGQCVDWVNNIRNSCKDLEYMFGFSSATRRAITEETLQRQYRQAVEFPLYYRCDPDNGDYKSIPLELPDEFKDIDSILDNRGNDFMRKYAYTKEAREELCME